MPRITASVLVLRGQQIIYRFVTRNSPLLMPLNIISERLVHIFRSNGIRPWGENGSLRASQFLHQGKLEGERREGRGQEREKLGKEEGVVGVLGK